MTKLPLINEELDRMDMLLDVGGELGVYNSRSVIAHGRIALELEETLETVRDHAGHLVGDVIGLEQEVARLRALVEPILKKKLYAEPP